MNITRQFQDFIKSIERWNDLIENKLDLFIKNGADINSKIYELCIQDEYNEDYDEDYYETEPEEYEIDENILTFFIRHYVQYNNNYDINIIYYLLTRGAIPEKNSIAICANYNNYNDSNDEILKLIDDLLKYSEYSENEELILDDICEYILPEISEIFRGYTINLKIFFKYCHFSLRNIIDLVNVSVNPLELQVLNYIFEEGCKRSSESVIKELKKFYMIDDDKIINIIKDRCDRKRVFGNQYQYEDVMYKFMMVTCGIDL